MRARAKTLITVLCLSACFLAAGCGRKSQLETPADPRKISAPAKEGDPSVRAGSPAPEELDLAGARGARKSFFLDSLL